MPEGQPGGQNQQNPAQKGLSWVTPQTATKVVPVVPKPTPVAPPNSGGNKTRVEPKNSPTAMYAGFLVGGIIIGVLLSWGFSTVRSNPGGAVVVGNATTSADTITIDGTGSVAAGSNAFSVTSPQKSGYSVVIARAVVAKPTWVVVHDNRDGKPGNALGAHLFFPGAPDGTVDLLRATVVGKTYFVGQRLDDGDKKFSMTADKPVTGSGGEPVVLELRTN